MNQIEIREQMRSPGGMRVCAMNIMPYAFPLGHWSKAPVDIIIKESPDGYLEIFRLKTINGRQLVMYPLINNAMYDTARTIFRMESENEITINLPRYDLLPEERRCAQSIQNYYMSVDAAPKHCANCTAYIFPLDELLVQIADDEHNKHHLQRHIYRAAELLDFLRMLFHFILSSTAFIPASLTSTS